MSAPVVVFAVGNPSRGDDAIGPVFCDRLGEWLAMGGMSNQFELIEDFQLQIEHALDLRGRSLALFVDAGIGTPAPFIFAPIRPSTAVAHTTHALSPEAVLQVYRQTELSDPPPAYVLCIRGEQFDLGDPLSPAAMSHLTQAEIWMEKVCRQLTPDAWAALAAELAG